MSVNLARLAGNGQDCESEMTKDFGTFLVGIVYLAVLFVLVRPGSQGPTLVTNVSNGLSGLIKAGTGGGTWR
jgi:hypothetical protein